jgi:sugar transferase (PEP-CTERM/EpsH1 system associated)
MKILFLAQRTPYPPNRGEKIRFYHILAQLAKKHMVSLAYWVDDPKDFQHVNLLRTVCKGGRVLPVYLNSISARLRASGALARGRSFSEGYFYSRQFRREIDRLVALEQYDLVYVFSSVMAQYLPHVTNFPVIVDFVGVDSDKWGQLAKFKSFPLSGLFRLEQKRLLRFECKTARWASASVFISQAEADLFKGQGGQGALVVIPNGVDSDLRRLPVRDARFMAGPAAHDAGRSAPTLIFVGTMNYYPNEDAVVYFAHEILPIIQKQFPQVSFEIVGRAPSSGVRRLNGIAGIRIWGEVGDVRAHLAQADVSVAPMRIARGVQNKVLEAMAVGIPVVASSEAVKGMPLVKGDEVLIGDSPEEFAAEVVRVLTDGSLYSRVAAKGHNCVVENYSWKVVGAQLAALVESLAKPAAGAEMNFTEAKHGSV